MVSVIRIAMNYRPLSIFVLFFLLTATSSFGQRIKVYDRSQVKEIHYGYRGLNGSTSATIDDMLEWFYNPEDLGSLSFKLMFNESILVEFVDEFSYEITVNVENLYVRNLSDYAGFDLSEAFMPKRVQLYVDVFKNDRRWKAKRIEAPIVNHGLREPVTFTIIDSVPGVRAKISGHDFMFTKDSERALMKELALINEYIDAFEALDAIGLRLNGLDENTTKVKVFENQYEELERLIKRYWDVDKKKFWNLLDYKTAEKRSGYNIERTRDEVRGYLAYKKEEFNLAKVNFHKIYFDKGLEFYEKGKKSKALENFVLAKQSNPDYAPTRYMIGLHLYEEGLIDSSAAEVQYVLSSLEPDQETYDKSLELAYTIKQDYMDKGLSLIGTAPEDEVVGWFRKALELCRNSMEMVCDQRDFEEAMNQLRAAQQDQN